MRRPPPWPPLTGTRAMACLQWADTRDGLFRVLIVAVTDFPFYPGEVLVEPRWLQEANIGLSTANNVLPPWTPLREHCACRRPQDATCAQVLELPADGMQECLPGVPSAYGKESPQVRRASAHWGPFHFRHGAAPERPALTSHSAALPGPDNSRSRTCGSRIVEPTSPGCVRFARMSRPDANLGGVGYEHDAERCF